MSYSIIAVVLLLGICLLAALSWKWCLPTRISSLIILLATIGAVAFGSILVLWNPTLPLMAVALPAAQLFIYAGSLLYRFYRDPERVPPSEPGVLVSPADGKVIYINKLPPNQILQVEKKGTSLVLDELSQSELPKQELWQIGISMVFTDVHVNRVPMAGRVMLIKHRPGKFLSLRRNDAVNVNERQTMLIEKNGMQIAVVQIASRLVRRIEAYVHEGELLKLGQRIGIIKFGSQVDIFVPTAALNSLCITRNNLLVAGVTVIGLFKNQEEI